jgi:hypothetical protein
MSTVSAINVFIKSMMLVMHIITTASSAVNLFSVRPFSFIRIFFTDVVLYRRKFRSVIGHPASV